MDLNLESILKTFRAESEDNLSHMEQHIVALESDPDSEHLLRSIFRVVHTTKGNASCMGLHGITEFTHVLEDLLDLIRKRRLSATASLVSLLLESVDALREMIASAVIGDDSVQPKQRRMMNRLAEQVSRALPSNENAVATTGTLAYPRAIIESTPAVDQNRSLRVDVDKLDSLMNLTGEIAIARTRIRRMLEDLGDTTGSDLIEMHQASDRLHFDLQELVKEVRRIPLDAVFRQYLRTVRDLAKLQRKTAKLFIDAADAEVDTTVVQHLLEPLSQMIRNAVEHGIEPPDTRAANGKETEGRITLRAVRQADRITIDVEDDGAGLDREKIAARAAGLGLIPPDRELTEREINNLILEAGVSTADPITGSSSGVGMDVVRRNIETLGGRIAIDSTNGAGTRITISLPLSLATLDGLAVGVAGETFVIPLNTVIECLDLADSSSAGSDEAGTFDLRGTIIPFVRLQRLFDMEPAPARRENLVVVRNESDLVGIAVDDLYGESQVVLKPLGRLFHGLPGLSGSTILGNGRVALILDVPTLLRNWVAQVN
jgi:two-component system, chemotaxis family, sensor kinase CheA